MQIYVEIGIAIQKQPIECIIPTLKSFPPMSGNTVPQKFSAVIQILMS